MSCPSDIRVNLTINSTAFVNWTEPVALDNSDVPPQVTVAPPGITPPYVFNESTLIVYTATDASGNKKECSFKVVLEGESEMVLDLRCSFDIDKCDRPFNAMLHMAILKIPNGIVGTRTTHYITH